MTNVMSHIIIMRSKLIKNLEKHIFPAKNICSFFYSFFYKLFADSKNHHTFALAIEENVGYLMHNKEVR